MAGHKCETCPMRKRYDRNPGSLLGRLWKWHTRWCPGWKKYTQAMAAQNRKP
jgi:hypothetical protein